MAIPWRFSAQKKRRKELQKRKTISISQISILFIPCYPFNFATFRPENTAPLSIADDGPVAVISSIRKLCKLCPLVRTRLFNFKSAGDLIVYAQKSIKVSEGEDGSMECRATSVPAATITWFVNGTKVTSGEKYEVKTKDAPAEPDMVIGTLTVMDVSLDDGRPVNYTCSATNGVYTEEEVVILRIRGGL